MGSDTCKLRRFESPVRIDIGVSWREIDEARAETENENHKGGEKADIDNCQMNYIRVIPVNLKEGEHNERFENQVHGRNTPAVAQWTVGRSDLPIYTSPKKGVGEKEKD